MFESNMLHSDGGSFYFSVSFTTAKIHFTFELFYFDQILKALIFLSKINTFKLPVHAMTPLRMLSNVRNRNVVDPEFTSTFSDSRSHLCLIIK